MWRGTDRREDARLIQFRRGSTVVEASGDERRDPDVEMIGSGLPSGSAGEAPRDEGARESTRTGTEAAGSSRDASRAGGADESMRAAPEDAE